MEDYYDETDFYPERIIRNDDRRGLVHLEEKIERARRSEDLTSRERVIARKGGAQ